ncbi:hypothetical protein NMG60_11001749 [Bertholletia excelsa]
MDECSGKRAVGGLVIPRKESGHILRGAAENRDRDAQFCKRIGCNGRLNHPKSARNEYSEKLRSTRAPYHPPNGKEIIGNSSRSCGTVTNTRKSRQEYGKKFSSQVDTDSSTTSSVLDEPEVSRLVPAPARTQTGFRSETNEAESSKVRSLEAGSSSMASGSKPRKGPKKKSAPQDTLLGSSVPLPSRSSCMGARNVANSRYGLRNLRCNSISDIVCSGDSPSEPNLSTRKHMVKKRNPDVDSSSSSRGKRITESLSEVGRCFTSASGISISDSRQPRNWSSSRDSTVLGPVRARRSVNGNTRARLCSEQNGSRSVPMEIPIVNSHVPQSEVIIGLDVPSSSNQFSPESSSSHSVSSSMENSSPNFSGIMPIGPSEVSITRSFINCDGLHRYAMDGIAEVLLALDRIEQDEELTYEQLLALETNLLLGGFSFYDQHRDMRLDIDNMSYEELLALEEKIGSVSTALSEETISKCLERSIYYPSTPRDEDIECCRKEDDVKCSICQEEYVSGDEVGRLECKHGYHVVCIQQWLRLKNWCPICKASVVPSQLS